MELSLREYQKQAVSTAIYPEQYKVMYPALGLAGETGEVCEKIKKVFRDDFGEINDDKKQAIKKELGDVLWYLANLADDLGIDFGEVGVENLLKLASREERGVLGGSGDNR